VPRSSDRRAAPVAVPEDDGGLGAVLTALGREAGLAAVGIGAATVFEEARRVLFERKGRGLDGGMQFTYRNPERSTDPGRILAGARSLVVGAWSYRRGAEVGTVGAGSFVMSAGGDGEVVVPGRLIVDSGDDAGGL